MNPRRPYSNRPGGRRFSSGGSGGGSGGGARGGFGGRPRRGGGGANRDLPVLLGEPSPSLAKINGMNMEKLAAKILSLRDEQLRLNGKLEKLLQREGEEDVAEKIEQAKLNLERLKALEAAATERLAGKAQRKAQREQRR